MWGELIILRTRSGEVCISSREPQLFQRPDEALEVAVEDVAQRGLSATAGAAGKAEPGIDLEKGEAPIVGYVPPEGEHRVDHYCQKPINPQSHPTKSAPFLPQPVHSNPSKSEYSPQPKNPTLAKPPPLPPIHTLLQLLHAHPLHFRHLFRDVPLRGGEEYHREGGSVFEGVVERAGGGLLREEVFLETLAETEEVG